MPIGVSCIGPVVKDRDVWIAANALGMQVGSVNLAVLRRLKEKWAVGGCFPDDERALQPMAALLADAREQLIHGSTAGFIARTSHQAGQLKLLLDYCRDKYFRGLGDAALADMLGAFEDVLRALLVEPFDIWSEPAELFGAFLDQFDRYLLYVGMG